MTFEEAAKDGKVVVVAGAGISKDYPANLPSWWDYNIILLECIGQMGAKAFASNQNLLDMEIIKKGISVTSVSEFFVDRIAGEHYYPLLSMLDGAQPNIHHFMLAQLFGLGIIHAIVTTNFDTLIEKAFEQKKISFSVYNSSIDYYQEKDKSSCAIYKIHGSADQPEFAIDTIHQKMKGLSIEKKHALRKLFAENHILFVGFSGEDFLFGTDYIPISANKANNLGITWIEHPGSTFNTNTQNLINELNVDVRELKLSDFYQNQGWDMPEVSCTTNHMKGTFRELAREKILELLTKIGKWACLGMCIELMELLGEHDRADEVVLKTLHCDQFNIVEMPQKISLFSNLAAHAMARNKPEEALVYCNHQINTFERLDKLWNRIPNFITDRDYRAISLNKSTVVNRKGLILFNHYEKYMEAREYFLSSFHLSYEAQSWENMAVALSNIALAEYFIWGKEKKREKFRQPHFIPMMEAAQRIAEHGGYAQIIFSTSCELVRMYVSFGQKKFIEKYLKKAEQVKELCIEKQSNNTWFNQIKEMVQAYTEMPPWPKDKIPLCAPYDNQFLWQSFGQRPVLRYEEGKRAKELYESGHREESIYFLIDSAEKYFEQMEYEMAEMLFDCLAGLFLAAANDAMIQEDAYVRSENILNGRKCYKKCLIAEIFMGRIDYLAGTLGSLAKINSVLGNSADEELALFQAELALCICNDPIECWQSAIAAETACRIHLRRGRKVQAEEYGKMYFEMVKTAPWATDPSNVTQMEELLKEC